MMTCYVSLHNSTEADGANDQMLMLLLMQILCLIWKWGMATELVKVRLRSCSFVTSFCKLLIFL